MQKIQIVLVFSLLCIFYVKIQADETTVAPAADAKAAATTMAPGADTNTTEADDGEKKKRPPKGGELAEKDCYAEPCYGIYRDCCGEGKCEPKPGMILPGVCVQGNSTDSE